MSLQSRAKGDKSNMGIILKCPMWPSNASTFGLLRAQLGRELS